MRISAIVLAWLLLTSFSKINLEMVVADESVSLPRTRAAVCSQYSREYQESEWDPASESFPTNVAWERCMGLR